MVAKCGKRGSAREKRGLSLEQAAADAGIPMQYLRLLEGESNVRVGVSDELYLIPFFRKYAHFVEQWYMNSIGSCQPS